MMGTRSLSQRQLLVMLSALGAIAAVLAAGGSWVAASFAERSSDRVLKSAASAIAETLTVEDGSVQARIPAGAFTSQEDSRQDSVFYNVSQGGRVLTGYTELRVRPPSNGESVAFRYDEVFGERVRVAVQRVDLPRQDEPVIVQIAETLNDRQRQTLEMLAAILGMELALVLAAAALIKPAVRWGLKPVERLQAQLSGGNVRALTLEKLQTHGVPRELQGLVEAFNQLLARLGDALSAHRRFTGDASHQMRTPLTILKSHIAVLQRTQLPNGEARQSVDDVAAACARLERLLSQLLKLARAEGEGMAGGAAVATDLSELTADLCRRVAPDALRADIEIQFESEGPVTIATNPLVVEEIVWNLIDNAVRYNRAGGLISVRVARLNGAPVIDVEDSGPGIATKDRVKIFERFHRLARDGRKEGSGLGLAISRTLASAVGARVDLAWSEPGRGSRFRVEFAA